MDLKNASVKKKYINKKLKWALIIIPVFLVLLTVSSVVYFEIKYKNAFFPKIVVAGEQVGGKSYAEVLNHFQEKANIIEKNGLTFNIGGTNGSKEVQIPTFFNGLTTDKVFECFSLDDWENSLKSAYAVGRKDSLWQKIKEQARSLFKEQKFSFTPIIQKETVASFLDNNLEEFLVKSAPAQFTISNGQIHVLPEIIGEKINTEEIFSLMSKRLALFDSSPTTLHAQQNTPFATKEKLDPFLDFAENIGSSVDINFHYKYYSWHIDGNTLVTWLTVKENGEIGINEQKVEDYFNKTVIFYIDSPMQNSRFEMRGGKLVEITPGKFGNVADIEKSIQKIEESISNITENTINIQIETIVQEPKVTQETIDKYKIKELVGSATTNFQGGSLDRQHNIETGASILNGVLLAPGEEFSAVNSIGEITKEAGFVEEYVISGGKTTKELGGGLCQIATTLFRLALDTGLPIVERSNHRYVIPYYGAGLDATIYGPHPDLRFINDTGNYLLLQGRAVNNEVTFEFYGKKDGRIIEISKPKLYNKLPPPDPKYVPTMDLPLGKIKCSEIPHSGITADVTYTVTYPTGNIKKTNFHSVYQPWQKVCLLGTKS